MESPDPWSSGVSPAAMKNIRGADSNSVVSETPVLHGKT
jgi:hypothetical protein